MDQDETPDTGEDFGYNLPEWDQELRDAIEGRVLIERATGVIGERFGLGMGAAREMLTVAAGSSGRPLAVVAREVLGRRRAVRVRPFRS